MKNKSYRYTTRTAAGQGRYTTQASPRGKVTTAEVIADLSELTNLTGAQTEHFLRTFCQYVIERTTDSWRIEPLFDLLGFNASSGGIFDSYIIAPTFDNLKLSINMVVGRSGYNIAREGFTAELMGSQGRVVPIIRSVTNKGTNTVNTYTPGQGLELTLTRYGIMDLEEPAMGVFLTNSDGTATQVTSYLKTTGATVYCIVPGGLTGPQQLSIVQGFGNENRTGVFDFILQPASMTRRAPLASTVTGNGNGATPTSRATRPAGHVTASAPRSRNRTGKPQPKPAPRAKATAK